jgi:nitrite reductase/ring-hydroxylating ferredoxin subunit
VLAREEGLDGLPQAWLEAQALAALRNQPERLTPCPKHEWRILPVTGAVACPECAREQATENDETSLAEFIRDLFE